MIGSSSLLSRLSKTTAPMRAKLSAISRSTSNNSRGFDDYLARLDHLNLDRSHSTSLSIPLRRSAESIRDIAHLSLKSGNRAKGERSQSFSWDKSLLHDSFAQEEAPTIYAALLSKVAHAFKEHITLTTRVKDSLTYKDVFDGKEAVDKLSFLTKFTDRKLVLVLGRALEAQRFFHDVNYEHQLRDSVQELYHFKEHIHLPIPMTSTPEKEIQLSSEDLPIASSHTSIHVDDGLPNGIFTVLTRCYSPTCTQNKYCYSPLCPRLPNTVRICRRLNLYLSLRFTTKLIEERLWISTVSKDVSQSISSEERKRQENMFELIYTEKDFVDDIAYLQTYWITPLLAGIEGSEKSYEPLVNELFWNIMEIHTVSEKLSESLLKLQSADPIIHRIGDTLLKHVVKFEPFVDYGAHQIISKYVLETEKSTNSDFSRFVEATERLPQSRKLELNGYLTKPTTRLGRYNLILREIVKHTSKDHPDQEDIPKVMKIISEFLSKVNEKTGKAENMFNLKMLREKLKMRNPSELELALQSEQRKMIFKGPLKKKGTGSESSDMQVYLIDTCIIITKQKYVQNTEHHKIYKKPIPLALLALTLPDQTKRVASLLPYGRSSTGAGPVINSTEVVASNSNKGGHPISFAYLGRQGFGPITLYATTILARRQWVHKIEHQRLILTEKQKVFNVMTISEKFFNSLNRVNCAVTHGKLFFYHQHFVTNLSMKNTGQSILIGSDQGVYMKKNNNDDIMVRLLAMEKVSQIDILEGSNLILVLADKILYTYSLDSLLSEDTSAKRGRKISSHVSFFKVGKVLEKTLLDKPSEKTLVCFVRYNAITSTIRALEPHTTGDTKKKNKPHLGLFMRGSNEGLKVYKDLYIPGEATSIQYFKNIICVGSAKGFQMVNIASAEVQSVLDPRDEGHNFILQKENLKPISMFRHPDGTILLCYNEIAFYIDKKGKRMRDEWIIQWEGAPTAFAFQFPYVIAFDSTFIEVRHMNTVRYTVLITAYIYCVYLIMDILG
ncbi:CNH domain-containing protein [Spinellus fusiger]|nr:CNH domain-containing protein [Spinellus fusiger]